MMEKLIVKVTDKNNLMERAFHIQHDWYRPPNEGVLVKRRITQFGISIGDSNYAAIILGNETGNYLYYILDFDISRLDGTTVDVGLLEKLKDISKRFDEECSNISVSMNIEILFSTERRVSNRLHWEVLNNYKNTPLIYYPFGFETYTSNYSREGLPLPEVISVEIKR